MSGILLVGGVQARVLSGNQPNITDLCNVTVQSLVASNVTSLGTPASTTTILGSLKVGSSVTQSNHGGNDGIIAVFYNQDNTTTPVFSIAPSNVRAITPTTGDNSTNVATTAFVRSYEALNTSNYASSASPTFTGTITAPFGSIASTAISGLATSATTDTTNATNITSGTLAVLNGGTGATAITGSGSNVLHTSPTLVTPVLGTPTSGTLTNCTGYTAANITGTLAVANGGTGATAITGSGSNVLSTSPTLVTPVLGTPTSGTLTNCTGYTAANITGTLAVANGGTGATTSTGSGSVVLSASPTLTGTTTVTNLTVSGKLVDSTRVSFLARGTASAGVFTYAAVSSPSAPDLYNGTFAASCYHQLGTTLAANLAFTPPYAGYYLLCFNLGGFTTTGRTVLVVTVGSSDTEVIDQTVSSTSDQYSYSVVLRLAVIDVVTPTYKTIASFGYPGNINFSGHLLYQL